MSESGIGRWCVIGAGPAGLLAARALTNARIPYDQFEKQADVGGLWDIDAPGTPLYESAHLITSKGQSALPGYPMPDDFPTYPRHDRMLAYLRAFARDHQLYPKIRFETAVERAEKAGEDWMVRTDDGEERTYAGLFVCSGIHWRPSLPHYPGSFDGEAIHSVDYRSPEQFRGRRVLVVGGGNSGCDLACDAAIHADRALLSLRRGYHFVPKLIGGMPSDHFAESSRLPIRLQRLFFELVLRLAVGDPRRYGLPTPDHRVLESNPIMNTRVLHHLSHGDLEVRPDVDALDGSRVRFVDGSAAEVDLVVWATGYDADFPFLDRELFEWGPRFPDLFLGAFHRQEDTLCLLGLTQTAGGSFDFFARHADMMCNFILDRQQNPERAERFRRLRQTRPDLGGGFRYVDSPRHATYQHKATFARYCRRLSKELGWRSFVEP
jgi:cation diffusion facilitator CzcD-associated flavoprotein CzcO